MKKTTPGILSFWFLLAAVSFPATGMEAAGNPPPATGATPAAGYTLWQLPGQTETPIMSYVIRTPRGKLIVIDGGNENDAAYLREFLKKRGGKVDAWFITHPHKDHVFALAEILKEGGGITVKTIYGSPLEKTWVRQHASSVEYKELEEFNRALEGAMRWVTELRLGETLEIDGIRIEVLGVRNPGITENAINNSSLVLRISDASKSVLFPGDLGVEGGKKLLNGPYARRLPSDYVQMAHHGQRGVSEEFYRRVNPRGCLWPTPRSLWDNDNGGGPGSGPWRTLEVRAWMEKLPVTGHFLMFEGLSKIR